MAGLCLGWVVSCLRFCSCMNENWPCLETQKSIAGNLVGSGSGQVRSGPGTDPNRSKLKVDVESKSGRVESDTSNGKRQRQRTNQQNKRRAHQAVACPSWLVGGVVTRGSRGSEAGRD